MSREWTREQVIDFIKRDLLLDRLDLANAGVTLEDIKDDTPLLHEGLAIDSVDAMDLLVGVEKNFGLKLPELGKSFIESTCRNVECLADYIVTNLNGSRSAPAS